MTAPVAPPVTSVTATVADLFTQITAHPTWGVYIYLDVATPTGAGVAASAVDSSLRTHYEADSAVVSFFQGDATTLDYYKKLDVHEVVTKYPTKVYNNVDFAASHLAVTLDPGTVLYVKGVTKSDANRLIYEIYSGTYVGNFVSADDVLVVLR